MNTYHTSVLLQEVIKLLDIRKGANYIDATLGGGGHTIEIIGLGGIVLGIDADEEALDFVKENLKSQISNLKLTVVKGNFKDIEKIAQENDFNKVAGIVFDLGVSSHQLANKQRGFSYLNNGPLDMRMDKELKVKAQDLVNILTKGELYELFNKLGEERFARSISGSIVSSRRVSPIRTTTQLLEVIKRAVPKGKLDTASRVYQALRIAVNDELTNLKNALPQAFNLLEEGGKIAVISFHSLEDRIIKNQFANWQRISKGNILTKKPVRPSKEEVERNKRSRSAKLRVFQKI